MDPSPATPTLLRIGCTVACSVMLGQASPKRVPVPSRVDTTTPAADIYVSPCGEDTAQGTRKDPLGSLAGAKRAVRALRQQRPKGRITVEFQDGVYPLSDPVVFEPGDGGPAESEVIYKAATGASPLITGQVAVPAAFKPSPSTPGLWTADIKAFLKGRRFEQLFINGRRALRARWPASGYLNTEGTVPFGTDAATGKVVALADHTFLFNPKELAAVGALPPDKLKDVVVTVYHSWDVSRHHISRLDMGQGLAYLTGTPRAKFNQYLDREKYYVDNFLGALDGAGSAGQWFLAQEGILYYRPLPGEDVSRLDLSTTFTPCLLRFAGTDADHPVSGLSFQGLTFGNSAYMLPPDGQWSIQAACDIDAAIVADYASNISFLQSTIRMTGGYGIWFRTGCLNSSIRQCQFDDLGAGAIRLGQTATRPNPAQVTKNITVDNNIITNGGRIWPDAVGILVGHSASNEITHNDISRFAYSGISAGWVWSYGVVPSIGNRISYNHIHHLGWDVLGDMGGIYTLGESAGSIISNNHVHDIDGGGVAGMHGIYNDNSSSGFLVENNLVHDVRDGMYHIGSGRGNILRNNIFVASSKGADTYGQIYFSMYNASETWTAATFQGNIIVGSTGKLIGAPPFGSRLAFDSNLYWGPTAPLTFMGSPLAAWKTGGQDRNSLQDNPLFVNFAGKDFHLAPNSPAIVTLGFKPFDPDSAGVYGDGAWVKKAAALPLPPPYVNPTIPNPVTFTEGFESTPAGMPPPRVTAMTEGSGDSILVSGENPAGGTQCLRVYEPASLKDGLFPFFWYPTDHRTGTTTLSMDVKLSPEAGMTLEVRDVVTPTIYYTGPRLSFTKGALWLATATGPLTIPVPSNAWMHLDLSVGLGTQANGTWKLGLTLPGKPAVSYPNLVFNNPKFSAATWVGFTNCAIPKVDTSYFLDNLRISRLP